MNRSTVRSALLAIATITLALLVAPSFTPAAPGTTIDCHKDWCRECCCIPGSTPEQCVHFCETTPWECCNEPPCTVIYKVVGIAGPPQPIKINLGIGNVKLQFKAKPRAGGFVDIKLKQTVLSELPAMKVLLQARIGGPDATMGGLLLPVAFLAEGSGAATQLADSQGLQMDVIETSSQICQATMPPETCTALARHLGATILSSLQLADGWLADPYRSGLELMALAPCGE